MVITAGVLLLALAVFATNARDSAFAQTTPQVDYDLDNDGLIEVRNADQWQSIADDLDGDGIVTNTSAHWNTTGFPNAMTAAGCPARDHDTDPATPDEASCIGYELINDITPPTDPVIAGTYRAKFVGNGFRVLNPSRMAEVNNLALFGTLHYSGTIEGLGVINPSFNDNWNNNSRYGGIVGRLEGKVIGSYVEGGAMHGDSAGGIAGSMTTHATEGHGLIAHSYARGMTIGYHGSQLNGGLVGFVEHQRGTNQATCLNSYASNRILSVEPDRGLVIGTNENGQGRFINCIGDSNADSEGAVGVGGAGGATTATRAAIQGALDYDTPSSGNPFSGFDDYPLDGSITQLGATEPRTDAWYFGDTSTFPVLKAWGHDRTIAMARTLSGTDTVNLCTRTLAVANEIIRLLKDDTFATGVAGPVPAAVTALGDCTSSTDDQSVSIDNLRDFAATTAANPLNLSPGRTDPASTQITSLDLNDFAYLVNASHYNLAGNAIETLSPRLFQGIPLRWLDVSNNALTAIPADLFAGVATPTETTGNAVHFSGNSLTDTGIPGRVFDSLTWLNGLDLSGNAITRINTRWFEALENLGAKPSTATAPVSYLGIDLSDNPVTEHHYSENIFSGVRLNAVSFTGSSAGDDLRTAIKAAITAAAGGTTPTTLDLDSVDYYVLDGASAGYQASGAGCPTNMLVGLLAVFYGEGDAPECLALPHWTPPGTVDVPSGSQFTATAVLAGDQLSATFSHAATASYLAYQWRYRQQPSDPMAAWTDPWTTRPFSAGVTSLGETVTVATGVPYQIQMRVVTLAGMSAHVASAVGVPDLDDLEPLMPFEVVDSAGTLLLRWSGPTDYDATGYEYRTRRAGATEWSRWTRVDHVGARDAPQERRLIGLDSGVRYNIQMRIVTPEGTSPVTEETGAIRVSVPVLDAIEPELRTLTVPAGGQILLGVNLINTQNRMENEISRGSASVLNLQWSEEDGRGTFTSVDDRRRITYTAPDSPGRYTVTAEAQPDGICTSHHEGDSAITAADRAPCIATFTIQVTRAAIDPDPQPDPINPAGTIPTSLTDDSGAAYAVFTPVDGGTFTGSGFTVSAAAGAVPDQTFIGVNAQMSAIPVPAPIPGASMYVAGSFYDVNGISSNGGTPLTGYALDDPLDVCLPFPDELRADLSNVVVVHRDATGNLGILTSKIRTNAGGLTVCGAVSTLPATVGVAKLGTVPAPVATAVPEQQLPVTGGAVPNAGMLVLMLVAGLAVALTGMYRIGRIMVGRP